MMNKSISVLDTRAASAVIYSIAAAAAAYFLYSKVKEPIDKATQAVSTSFLSLFQDEGVTFTDFDISRLHRDFFNADWVMLEEPQLTYRSAYPQEMSELLTADGQLKERYRGQIK